MKRWLKKRKARGFTLVELLIVIVIIGILAGSLLLVMGSGTDKANATKIASNLRTIKAAELMYYADEGKFIRIEDISAANSPSADAIAKYLDRRPDSTLGTYFVEISDSKDYYAVFRPKAANENVLRLLGEMEGVET